MKAERFPELIAALEDHREALVYAEASYSRAQTASGRAVAAQYIQRINRQMSGLLGELCMFESIPF